MIASFNNSVTLLTNQIVYRPKRIYLYPNLEAEKVDSNALF